MFGKQLMLLAAVALIAPAASAQEYAHSQGGPEAVIVIAPSLDTESRRLNGPLEKISLSGAVRYDDLNLATRQGARELRWRVRAEARDVCERLSEAYPVHPAPGTSCYKEAADNGLVRAVEAVETVRQEYPDRYNRY